MNTSWIPTDWLLHSALGGGLILLITCLLMQRCRQPARRQLVGEWGLVAALALTILSLQSPWLTVPLLQEEGAVVVEASAVACDAAQVVPATSMLDETSSELGLPEAAHTQFIPVEAEIFISQAEEPARTRTAGWSIVLPPWARWVAALYALVAFLLMARWLIGYLALARLLRQAQPARGRVAQLFARMANGRPPRLLVSRRLSSPISCGLVRPTVVVPNALCRPEKEQSLRWVFAHELTHLERQDAWACLLFALGQAVYFYLPWFWWLRRQVRLSQEYIADAAAVEEGGAPEDYAQLLLNLTRRPVPMGATGVLGNSSDLFRRVTMLLQGRLQVEKRCPRAWSLAAASGLMALGVLVSGISLRAQAATALAPGQDEDKIIIKIKGAADDDDDDKDDKKKEVKKELEKKKEAIRKKLAEFPKINIPDFEDVLKNLPAELSKDQVEQLRKELMKAKEHIARAKEQFESVKPKVEDELRKEIRIAVDKAQSARNINWIAAIPGEGRLGVHVEKPSSALVEQLDLPKDQALVITQVRADSPADKVGLKVNDILLEVDGKAVPNESNGLIKMLGEIKADDKVSVTVLRKGKKERLRGLSLPEAKKSPETAARALAVTALQGLQGQQGAPAIAQFRNLAGGKGVMVSITRNDDNITARHQEGSLSITVTGTVKDGKVGVSEIRIQDGGKTSKHESIEEVPQQHRDKVKNLIDMSAKNKVETKTSSKGDAKDFRFEIKPGVDFKKDFKIEVQPFKFEGQNFKFEPKAVPKVNILQREVKLSDTEK